jgi:hypothetical protein
MRPDVETRRKRRSFSQFSERFPDHSRLRFDVGASPDSRHWNVKRTRALGFRPPREGMARTKDDKLKHVTINNPSRLIPNAVDPLP